jgi:hypothetical protein
MNRWSETCMLEQLRNESNEMLVIECNRRVLGYCLYEERKHSFRVLRFAVRTPNCGLGRMLMKNMHRRCLTEGKNRIDVSVDETEVGVQLFLSRVGFTAIGISGNQINFRHLRGDRC